MEGSALKLHMYKISLGKPQCAIAPSQEKPRHAMPTRPGANYQGPLLRWGAITERAVVCHMRKTTRQQGHLDYSNHQARVVRVSNTRLDAWHTTFRAGGNGSPLALLNRHFATVLVPYKPCRTKRTHANQDVPGNAADNIMYTQCQ